MPGLSAPIRHQSIDRFTDFQWRQPDLMWQSSGMRNQRLADGIEYLLFLESVGMQPEFVGGAGVLRYLQGCSIFGAERLVLPGERTRLGETHVNRFADVHGLLWHHERC